MRLLELYPPSVILIGVGACLIFAVSCVWPHMDWAVLATGIAIGAWVIVVVIAGAVMFNDMMERAIELEVDKRLALRELKEGKE